MGAAVGPEQSTLSLVAMSRFPSLFVVILSAIIIGSTSQANAVPVEDFNDYRVADFIMEAVADSPQLKAMVARFINEMNENLESAERIHKPAKRNSELLNSLLGLPKNILKSGK